MRPLDVPKPPTTRRSVRNGTQRPDAPARVPTGRHMSAIFACRVVKHAVLLVIMLCAMCLSDKWLILGSSQQRPQKTLVTAQSLAVTQFWYRMNLGSPQLSVILVYLTEPRFRPFFIQADEYSCSRCSLEFSVQPLLLSSGATRWRLSHSLKRIPRLNL